MSERTETLPATESRTANGGFSERHPFLSYLASHWEPYLIGSSIPPAILGASYLYFGSGIDPIHPEFYNQLGFEVGKSLLGSAAIILTTYGVVKVGTILTASIQRFTQGHLHRHE